MAACCGLAKVPGFVQRYEKSQLLDIQLCVSDKGWPYSRICDQNAYAYRRRKYEQNIKICLFNVVSFYTKVYFGLRRGAQIGDVAWLHLQ